MTASQQTKIVKQILSALIVRVQSDVAGTMVRGHGDELIRAEAKVTAAGFNVLRFGSNMLSAAAK